MDNTSKTSVRTQTTSTGIVGPLQNRSISILRSGADKTQTSNRMQTMNPGLTARKSSKFGDDWKSFCRCIFTLMLILPSLFACDASWWQKRHTAIIYDVTINQPEIPSLSASSASPLIIQFSVDQQSLLDVQEKNLEEGQYEQSEPLHALRLSTEGRLLNDQITMQPAVEGKWTAHADTLIFNPKFHWAANVSYKITFSDDLFMDEVKLKQEEFNFRTKGLSVAVEQMRLYTEPDKPGEYRYASTLLFSHPVDPDALDQQYRLSLPNDTHGVRRVKYTLTPDTRDNFQANRRFFINSETIELLAEPRYIMAFLPAEFSQFAFGTSSSSTRPRINDKGPYLKEELQIPSVDDVYKVDQTDVQIVTNDKNDAVQTIVVGLTGPTDIEQLKAHLSLKLMPINQQNNQRIPWTSTAQITPDIQSRMEPIDYTVLPSADTNQQLFSLTFRAPDDRQFIMQVDKGLTSTVGYSTSKDFISLHDVPQYPIALSFLGEGSVLERTGAHEIGFVSRNLTSIDIKVAQISKADLHHLISQTGGVFDDTYFQGMMTVDDMAVITRKKIRLNNENPAKPAYASYDLSRHLANENIKAGVFLIEAYGENKNNNASASVRRAVLVTDIGFLVKNNADQTRDVFVQQLSTKSPLSGASVVVLGRNGRPVYDSLTDERGHAVIEDLSSLRNLREKEPIAIVIEKGNDFAYLPLNNNQRTLNVSRFDTGGQYISASDKNALTAFLFSDRGIYRPGETVKLAAIVRDATVHATKPFSVTAHIVDPRGHSVYQKSHWLPDDGFFELSFDTSRDFSTGQYTAYLVLNNDQQHYQQLGSVVFSVEEFQADRLSIETSVSQATLQARKHSAQNQGAIQGWLGQDELQFEVSLNNLFGTPAQDRALSAQMSMTATPFTFPDYPGFTFSDAIAAKDARPTLTPTDINVPNTDKNGMAQLSLAMNQFFGGTYRVNLHTQGFEESGGRSVQAMSSVLFSPRDYLIGHKSTDLNYLQENETHEIDLRCIDKFTDAIACPLQLKLIELHYVSTLIKQNDGTYQYQTIEKPTQLSSTPFTIAATGYTHSIDTSKAGRFYLDIEDQSGQLHKRIPYRVVGDRNTDAKLDKDARLELSLNRSEYQPGEWIELQIKAPYTGSGLISIESDKTHAFAWFQSKTNQSMQRIQVPSDLQGNAYVQVAFIRAPDSDEVFTAPLSYALAPFSLSKDPYKMELSLDAPALVQPGDTLKIDYSSSEPGRSLIFAVDEGILQAAKYQNPDALAFFLQKRALQVSTAQMFDLLLPEFSLLRSLSASGGGMALESAAVSPAGNNLNPFARNTRQPVAFWSGIVESGPTQRSVEFAIPDHFDGSVRVMAIALNQQRFAHASTKVVVKGPFVVTPNLPLVIAPGDTFDVSVGVSNQLTTSAEESMIQLGIEAGKYFDVLSEPSPVHAIVTGDEHTYQFKLKANQHLGSADIRFTAQVHNDPAHAQSVRTASSTISVRPATLLENSLSSGRTAKDAVVIPATRRLLSDHSELAMRASSSPSLLIDGLINYLEVFPHACTEQIVSQLSPTLAYLEHPNYLGNPRTKYQQVDALLTSLRARQLNNGGFALWPGAGHAALLPTVHTLHTLIDAEEKGVNIPSSMINKGLEFLASFAYHPQSMQQQPELTAYALYVLTRRGEQTNNALIQLQDYLDSAATQNDTVKWQTQPVAAFMAASFKILRRDKDASELIQQYQFGQSREMINHYDSALYRDAMVVYLLATHFEHEFDIEKNVSIEALIAPVFSGSINTLSSGRAIIALKAYADKLQGKPIDINIDRSTSILDGSQNNAYQWAPWMQVKAESGRSELVSQLDIDTTALKLSADKATYYQLKQIGYNATPPTEALAHGLEITKQFFDKNGQALNGKPTQGDDIIVRIKLRSTDNRVHEAVAMVDLLPGGVEIDRQSVRENQHYDADYIDIREDRLVVYASIGPNPIEVNYKVRVTTSGEFTVPASYANAMYDESITAHSSASTMLVAKAN